jgi:hypothetical protein
MIKKWDIGLIVLLLCLSFIPEGIFVMSGGGPSQNVKAVIQVNGELYKTIPLTSHAGTDTFTIQTKDGHNTVTVKDQSIAITEADCPDKICINEGFISKPGETIACLPHKVIIEVRAEDSSEPDVIPAR